MQLIKTNKFHKLVEKYLLNVLNFIFSVEENFNRISLMEVITKEQMREACYAIHGSNFHLQSFEIL